MRLLANASWPRLWLSTYTLYIYIYIDEASTTYTSNFQPIACDRWPPYVLLSDRSASSLRAVPFWPVLRTGYCRGARFLAAAFSDGSYLAHVTFCIVRGPPLFIVSPISQRGPASVRGPLPTNSARLVQSPRRRRWRGWTNVQSNTTCVPYLSIM